MSYPEKHIALFCNPTPDNEKALHIAGIIIRMLEARNIRHTSFKTSWPQDLDHFTEAWIIGGDGTLNWFINQYQDLHIPLSIFAGGSGNDFHWMLYGEIEVEHQVEKILQAVPRRVDAGTCNGRLFTNGVGIGFDGAIVKDLLGRKKMTGKATYLLSILKNIVGYSEKNCTIQFADETIVQDCFMISVANTRRYGGSFYVAPNASCNDALLDVNIIGSISPLNRIRYLPVIEKGEHLDLAFNKYKQTDHVLIHCLVPLHAHIDGEYIYETVFEIGILPKRFSFLY